MSAYPKTENLLVRDGETHKLIPGAYRLPQFEQVNSWLVTEKIDGTNVRLILDWDQFGKPYADIRGRTDKANLPGLLLQESLGINDPADILSKLLDAACAICGDVTWEEMNEAQVTMVVYGEAYGPGIQSGAAYSPAKQIRIFDVATSKGAGVLWRTWEDVEAVSRIIGLKTVPVLARGASTEGTYDYVRRGGLISKAATEDGGDPEKLIVEGVIARTDPYLYDYRGNRVLFKLKGHDLVQDS